MWRAVWPLGVNSPTLRPASSTEIKKIKLFLEGELQMEMNLRNCEEKRVAQE
jgi:hypothetical protein